MWWRLRHRDFRVLQPAERKAELRGWVRSGAEPGLIAYREGIPVGWCAVAPRSAYAGLAASRSLKPVDSAAGVWSVTCYFVARDLRRTGLMTALLGAAESHAKRHGGLMLEGYPVAAERLAGCAGYTGVSFQRTSALGSASWRGQAALCASCGRLSGQRRSDGPQPGFRRRLPATISNSYSRHSSAPFQRGVRAEGSRRISLGRRRSAVKT